MKRWLYPQFTLAQVGPMVMAAIVGALVAGTYGIVHDQITYTLSEEYFTRLKFDQFAYANFGFHPRVWVGTIGFLATWWVGFFVGWFLARVVVPKVTGGERWKLIRSGFVMVIGCALVAAVTGWLLASAGWYDRENWQLTGDMLRLKDVPAFVRVAFIHNGSYLGGLIGLVAALVMVKRRIQHSVLRLAGEKKAVG